MHAFRGSQNIESDSFSNKTEDGLTLGICRCNLNVARAFIGARVNLHLKDGSVIANVYISDAKREKDIGKPAFLYIEKPRKSILKILLKEIDWMERLNPYFQ
ncbi:MAG: hypothetical protein JSV05_05660 [Candidatus Bathyarchaeota archaeon]|nr:MAG: hypothetical protein JSV05_05660 [Candidatus Bathyarchaeota archaeon]